MKVLVQCDDQICRDEALIQRVEAVITGSLERFSSRISRVEASLRDLNSARSGDADKICSVEARIEGSGAQLSVSDEATTLAAAIHNAADKLKKLIARELQQLDSTKLDNPQANPSARPL
jgi:ribosome-associated translation inhibitor RaiA